jgi:K(+)-stimulated pyrophosphate-energized sodium pump
MVSLTDTFSVERHAGSPASGARARIGLIPRLFIKLAAFIALAAPIMAQAQQAGEANLKLPDLGSVTFLGGITGHNLLLGGLVVSALGLMFGLIIFIRLRNLPVHQSMREVSELIYETCKTYLATQGKFLCLLECFIAVIIIFYFGFLQGFEAYKVAIILLFSVIGISGSFAVAAFGMRVNTFANSRTAFASLKGKPFPCFDIPLQSGMSVGMMLVSVELMIMLFILLFIPGDLAGACFIGFAIGESLGAAALRVAGGIFTKIADIGSDLMKIVFKIKEDDARNPGVIADCTGDNAGDSVGPSADGFETYGVTGVALITFILLAVASPLVQVQLLVWIFSMRVMMVISSAVGYFINGAIARARFGNSDKMNFEQPLTSLVWLTSILSIALTYVISSFMIPDLGGDASMWWKLATVISCGTLAGAVIPEFVKVFTSTHSRHVQEIVISSREGGASLNILSGFVAGFRDVVPDEHRLFHEHHVRGQPDAGPGGVRFRAGGFRVPRHGAGDHRRG